MKRLLPILLLVACKPSADEGAARFCDRVKPQTPSAGEQCKSFYVGLRGVAKECIDDCTANTADGDAFEGCRESCMGQTAPVQDVCIALKRTDLLCVSHYVTMQKSEGKKYGCTSRCIMRDKNDATCAASCGTSAAPPAPAGAIPTVIQ